MGAGASTQEVADLRLALEEKEAEIMRLQALTKSLEASKASAEEAAAKATHDLTKSHEISKATRPSVVGRPSLSKGGPGHPLISQSPSTTSFATRAHERKSVDPAKKRRVEVSAEVMQKAPTKYKKVVYPKSDGSKELILKAIQSNILFQGLSQGEQSDCVDAFQCREHEAGVEIITQGDQGENFYVVQSGTLDILVSVKSNPPIKFGALTSGMGFGELALLCNTPRAATIKSKSSVVLWALDRNDFREICTTHEAMRHAKAVEFLRQVEVLKKLSSAEIIRVAAAMQWEEYESNTVIFREGEMGEHFYVITSGEVQVTKLNAATEVDEFVRVMSSGDHFGELALLKDDTRSATAASIKYKLDIPFQDLEIMHALGSGAFGRVKLVRHMQTDQTFALKCLVKSHIVANNLKDHVVNEKKVMMMLDHPFILKLHHTYKDDLYVYFLLELALGGELFTFLRRRERFEEAAARFYVASVVLAFEHMHQKMIAYRDLKPENLILDASGFLKGHDKAVDYWALGVLIYELIAGTVPFFADDPMQVYSLVLTGNIKFPVHFRYKVMYIKHLVQKLLAQNPVRRLGNLKHGVGDIINHRWFSGYDWDGLLKHKLTPPIIPQLKNNMDSSNFERITDELKDVTPCAWDPDF
ncbi:hypothetical protein DYB35_012180 [Aphanomyces astaci]|uniref:cGMP-dependent protein kinase n=1 Tax=Aphanomyces astaci TaxID=112090 RepID=A0A3R6WCZ7_APHAT|nr:hypothetical protein DYB35_012180 [Aphanomyces astaci]